MVKSNPPSTDGPSENVLRYRSYSLEKFFFLTLDDIIGHSIFVRGGNNKRSNGALNVANFDVFSYFEDT